MFRGNRQVSYDHVASSIWPGLKPYVSTIFENYVWIIGDGKQINFWNDKWLSRPISNYLSFRDSLKDVLEAKVSDFITSDGNWQIPQVISSKLPGLTAEIDQLVIPKATCDDHLVWTNLISGSLCLKDAFLHLHPNGQTLSWDRLIWSKSIPPSKTFALWRFIQKKMPTDDRLMLRGCNLVSMCSMCGSCSEIEEHLFLDCPFVVSLWNWLSGNINHAIDLSSISPILEVCNKDW